MFDRKDTKPLPLDIEWRYDYDLKKKKYFESFLGKKGNTKYSFNKEEELEFLLKKWALKDD